jgi:uncharacterized protein YggE
MSLRALVLTPAVAVLVMAAPAVADQSKSVTATGTGTEKVVPQKRHSNASIAKAVDVARRAGIKGAMAESLEYAKEYAQAAGLTLGSVISVSDAQNSAIGYYGGPFFGPFGPNQYCGNVTPRRVEVVAGKKKVVTGKRVRRCFVPPFETTTLTVTYSAS